MRRMLSVFLALVLCVSFLPARAESAFPASQGMVTDLAGVLNPETIQDMQILSQRLEDAIGGELYIVTRHFLGGQDAVNYAKGIFDAWQLDDEDALLLLVIGEERYALALGKAAQKALPSDTQISLLATHFRGAYLNREYDHAVADFALRLAQTMAQAENESLNIQGLFGQENILATPAPQSWQSFTQDINALWQDMFDEDFYKEEKQREEKEEDNVNWRGIIIWGLVIYFLFFRKKKKKKKRK